MSNREGEMDDVFFPVKGRDAPDPESNWQEEFACSTSFLLRKALWVTQGQAHTHADMTQQGERLFQPTPNQLPLQIQVACTNSYVLKEECIWDGKELFTYMFGINIIWLLLMIDFKDINGICFKLNMGFFFLR